MCMNWKGESCSGKKASRAGLHYYFNQYSLERRKKVLMMLELLRGTFRCFFVAISRKGYSAGKLKERNSLVCA